MGSMITLGIEKLDIAWGKNDVFESFSDLFQVDDLKDIKYYYADNIVETKKGYSRKLNRVKTRLDLLGYTLPQIKEMYEDLYNDHNEIYEECSRISLLTFDEFYHIFTNIDLSKVNTLTEFDDWDFGEYVSKCVFQDKEIQKLLKKYISNRDGEFYENLPARLILRILCENPTAQDLSLQWRYMDIVDGGWIEENELVPKLKDNDKILIVTEGSSDTFILKKTIDELFPDISDFFSFIDMQDNYPFTGTGNLYNFSAGLSKIKIQNKTIVIFDNDDTGRVSYNKCIERLNLLPNLKFYYLPVMEEFGNFLTIGPTGETYEDINGKAVSIECFLDLQYNSKDIPKIRWTNFNYQTSQYQGSLVNKDHYTNIFKKNLLKDDYNKSKLIFLINNIIEFWCKN